MMKNSWLVQRLNKKPETEHHALVSQVFGGGLMQISKEGWKVIQSVCDLEYMGAAEFEFGTVPKCLSSLAADAKELVTFPLIIKRADIRPNFDHEMAHHRARRAELAKAKKEGVKAPRAKKPQPIRTNDAIVYVICRKNVMVEVGERIRELAKGKKELKRGDGFSAALDPRLRVRLQSRWLVGAR